MPSHDNFVYIEMWALSATLVMNCHNDGSFETISRVCYCQCYRTETKRVEEEEKMVNKNRIQNCEIMGGAMPWMQLVCCWSVDLFRLTAYETYHRANHSLLFHCYFSINSFKLLRFTPVPPCDKPTNGPLHCSKTKTCHAHRTLKIAIRETKKRNAKNEWEKNSNRIEKRKMAD